MARSIEASTVAKKKAAKKRPQSPGGPGGMDALRRAQAKMKEMGIKPYKPSK